MKRAVYLLIAVVASICFGCGKMNRAAEEKKYDSLFLGFSLGMEKKAFYDLCWEYNRKKVFTHGPTNQNVQYRLVHELDSPVYMRFYPTFYDDKISEMPVTFMYEHWSPWATDYKADTLFKKLLPVFKKWYGPDFKEMNHPTMGKVYYKMDGKRRINLFIRDDQYVMAVFTDLKVEKKLKELAAAQADEAKKQQQ
jgi:hypothetical protein